MATITKELTVDVSRLNTFQAIVAKQGDSLSRFLKITLTDNGTAIEIDEAAIATLNVERPDGESDGFLGVVNEDGSVTLPLAAWAIALDGAVKCSLSVVEADETRLTTTSFTINVEAVEFTGEGIEEDENYNILIDLLATSATAISGANEAAEAANEAAAIVYPTVITTYTDDTIELADNAEYELTNVNTLAITMPEGDNVRCNMLIVTGSTPAITLEAHDIDGDDITEAGAGETWEVSMFKGFAICINRGVIA